MATEENSSDVLDMSSFRTALKEKVTSSPCKEQDLRIVLVGKAGVGKSSTGNTITGIKTFQTGRSASCITTYSKCERGTFNEIPFLVIDTPGLFDTSEENSQKHVHEELKYCVKLCAPGIHAVVIVLSLGTRFTEEDKSCFLHFFETFGERFYDYAVVAFTGLDLLTSEEISFEQFINGNDVLKHFLEKCGNRKVIFNNKNPTEEDNKRQISFLMTTIMEMNTKNMHKYYTNELFERAESEMNKRELEMKDELQQQKMETDKKIEKLRKELKEQYREKLKVMKDKFELEKQKIITKQAKARDDLRRKLEEDRKLEEKRKAKSTICSVM